MSRGAAASASCAVNARLSVTASAASAAFLPRVSASVRAYAAASDATFFVIASDGVVSPPADTGCAAPMWVPGAITATSAARVMRNPADAARPPAGPTNTTTGAWATIIRDTMARVDSSSPPGVRSTMTVRVAPRASARVITSSMNSAATGWMIPSYSATMATGDVGAAVRPARKADANRNGTTRRAAAPGRFRMPPLYVAGPGGRATQKPIWARPRSVRSFSVARPWNSTSKSIAAKSGAERPSRNACFCFGRYARFFGQSGAEPM